MNNISNKKYNYIKLFYKELGMLKIANTLKKNRRILLFIGVILGTVLIIFFINFSKKDYKNINIGNNNSNKTLEEVEDYILNIHSFKATLEITIKSNKNTNKYIVSQTHSENEDIQEVIEPENIKGVRLIHKGNSLKVENTSLKLEKIYDNYPYIESNSLWLNSFISEYKTSEARKILKQDENIIMQTEIKGDSKIKHKQLFLDTKTLKPTKLSIQDNNKNEIIYILYNKIELNY